MMGGSYVDPKVLAEQLVGSLRAGAAGVATMDNVITAINAMADSKLKKQLHALSQAGSANVEEFIESVSVWVDRSLTMMGEKYKKRTQTFSFFIGLAIASIFNLDTVGISNHLYRDKEAREAVALVASDFVQKTSKETLDRCSKLNMEELNTDPGCAHLKGLLDGVQRRNDTLGQLPVGWPPSQVSWFPVWMTAPLGWLLTALAISLGASFWFDLLNRLVNVRHGMRRPQVETTDEKSTRRR